MVFANEWFWLIFILIGMAMVLLELIVGVDTGLDLVFIGSAFIIGGLVTWPFHLWIWTLIVTCLVGILYVALGRRFIHRWTASRKTKTNVDVMVGQKGIVLKSITPSADGRVRVRNEEWKARANGEIREGEEVIVTSVSGVTLSVEKTRGGQ